VAGEVSTIQSLKAVDAWIDVINANINGGVRTAFKSSRLKFSGSNTDVQRAGTSTSLPLQFPEPGLTTANTVIDFSQGAITASTETTHLALQGPGFFKLRPLNDPQGPNQQVYYSRDGEFRWMKLPPGSMFYHSSTSLMVTPGYSVYLLVNSQGLVVCSDWYNTPGDAQALHLIVNDATGVIEGGSDPTIVGTNRVADFLNQLFVQHVMMRDVANRQTLEFTRYGSTIFKPGSSSGTETVITSNQATILSKSLEASNASMTQSVPELSLAQKLFSALTKVLQTKQTNVDGVLNLVR
jgi:flagellar hook protein FlgE